MALSLVGMRSLFNSTVYSLIEKLQGEQAADPIWGLLGEQAHDSSTGDTVNFTSATLSGYSPIVPPGGDIVSSEVIEGDQLARVYFSIKDRMTVEFETLFHNKLDILLDRSDELSQKIMNTASLCVSGQFLNNANATTQTIGSVSQTITCADTLSLGSASHTVPGKAGTNYSNVMAGLDALSEPAITSLEQQIKAAFVDDGGTNLPYTADCLIVPDNADMIKKALQITGSTLTPGSNNNAINIYRGGRLDVVVLQQAPRGADGSYSTSKQYFWALGNKKAIKRAVKYRWALKPTDIKFGGMVAKWQDKNLDSNIYVAGRLVFGAPRWQGVGYSFSTTKPTTY